MKGFEILPIVRVGFKLPLWKAPPKQGRCPGFRPHRGDTAAGLDWRDTYVLGICPRASFPTE